VARRLEQQPETVLLKVHHLNNSRSQRILWLLEELGQPYDIVYHQRDATGMGPPELKAVHPIGKSPTIEDNGIPMVESGAIVDYIQSRYGGGRLMPSPDTTDYMRYLEWLHISVSSGYAPILLKVYPRFLGMGGTLDAPADHEFKLVLSYLENSLGTDGWLLGDLFTAADIQMSFVPELARTMQSIDEYPRIVAWLARCYERPGFKASVARGGRYDLAGEASDGSASRWDIDRS
jgi:glutathione S-transferase